MNQRQHALNASFNHVSPDRVWADVRMGVLKEDCFPTRVEEDPIVFADENIVVTKSRLRVDSLKMTVFTSVCTHAVKLCHGLLLCFAGGACSYMRTDAASSDLEPVAFESVASEETLSLHVPVRACLSASRYAFIVDYNTNCFLCTETVQDALPWEDYKPCVTMAMVEALGGSYCSVDPRALSFHAPPCKRPVIVCGLPGEEAFAVEL